MRIKLFFSLSIIFFFISISLQAQTFKAELDKSAVAVGENFTLTYTLAGKGDKFKAPALNDFRLIAGPSTSQSYTWINGKSSSKTSYTFILQANKEGAFNIQPAYVELDGKVFASNAVNIRVSGSSASAQFNDNTPKNAKNEIEKNIYIKTGLSKKTVYYGEPFVAIYRLYSHPSSQYEILGNPKMPVFNSFWAQDIDKTSQVVYTSEYINGYNYRRADFKKTILIPQKTGKILLDPVEMNINARIRVKMKQKGKSNSIFDDPFFQPETFQDYNYTLRSEPALVEVLPLPENAPSSFSGAIGEYTAKFSIDRNNVKQGEPITLRLEIEGSGNFPLIEAPKFTAIEGFDIFAPKSKDEYNLTEAGFSGKRTFEYIIIPKKIGWIEIPSLEFSFFNTALGMYQNAKSGAYKIEVEKPGILAIDFSNSAENSPSVANKIFLWVIAPGAIIVAFLIALFYYKKNKKNESRQESEIPETREEKPHSQKEYLSSAKKYAKMNEPKEFALALSNAIWLFLSEKLKLGLAELNRETALERLTALNIDKLLIENLIKALDIAEYIRYAPNDASKINLIEFADESEKLLREIDEKIG